MTRRDRPKGSATPWYILTLSVLLLCFLPNHPFSNLDFSSLGQPIFLKITCAVSKCSKFNNWPTFSKIITDLIHFRPHQTYATRKISPRTSWWNHSHTAQFSVVAPPQPPRPWVSRLSQCHRFPSLFLLSSESVAIILYNLWRRRELIFFDLEEE